MWLLLFMLNLASGESLESHYLRKIVHSHAAADIAAHQHAYEQLRILRTGCAIQLQEAEIPSLCYAEERLAVQLGVQTKDPEKQRRLDRLCIRAAEKLRLKQAATAETSVVCRAKVQEAQRIEAYRMEDREDWSEN